MRPLLLGMARGDGKCGPELLPSTSGDGNSAADRLLRISGMTREKYLASFERRNALRYGWSNKAARKASTEIRNRFRGRTVWCWAGRPGAPLVCRGSNGSTIMRSWPGKDDVHEAS